jgi:molybdopterin/thiamine biosynthesis adenylyltransferase
MVLNNRSTSAAENNASSARPSAATDKAAAAAWDAYDFIGEEVIEGMQARHFKLWVAHSSSVSSKPTEAAANSSSSQQTQPQIAYAIDYWDTDCNTFKVATSTIDETESDYSNSSAACRQPLRFDLVHPDIGRIMINVTRYEANPELADDALKMPFPDMTSSCIFQSHVPAMVSPFDSVPFVALAPGSPEIALLLQPTSGAAEVSLKVVKEMFSKPKAGSAAASIVANNTNITSPVSLAAIGKHRNLLDTTRSYSVYPCSASATFGWSGLPTDFSLQCSAQIGVM